MKLTLLFIAILISSACAPSLSDSPSAQQSLNSAIVRVTNAAINDQAEKQATDQARRQAEDNAERATAQAGNATEQADYATEQARQVISRATEQARADAANALTLEQAQAAATATRAALNRQMAIDSQNAQRIAAETQATITAANEAAATAKQTAAYKTDLIYMLPDTLMQWAPCGLLLFVMLMAWFIVRAIAARIAGDKGRAEIALAQPSLTVYLPGRLLLPPPPPPSDDDDENDGETGNTETPEYTGNTEGNSGETVFQVNSNGGSHPELHMTREEYHEIIDLRRKAIDLLARCVDYYRQEKKPDDGTIPRHDKIHMQPENRGAIVDGLWYSQFVIKTKNKTMTDPAYFPTCASLLEAIKNGRAKVYPLDYFESKQERLATAVTALPGVSP